MGKWHPDRHPSRDPRPDQPSGAQSKPPMSFIVRISRQQDGEFRGWIEEAESGEKTSFLGFAELKHVLSKYMALQ